MRSWDDRMVDLNLVANLGNVSKLWKEIYLLHDKYPDDMMMTEAIVTGIYPYLNDFKNVETNTSNRGLLTEKLSAAIKNEKADKRLAPKFVTISKDDNRTKGLKLFKKYCAACHGFDGLGLKNMAPTLANSSILKGPKLETVHTIFNGYDSGAKKYNMKMPAYINDSKMTDQDIADLISYLFSTFAQRWDRVKVEEVQRVRDTIQSEKAAN